MVGMGGMVGSLGARWPKWSAGAERRVAADHKLKVYGEAHLPLVHAAIDDYFGGGQVGRDVKRFASRSPNLAKATTDAVAVAYRSGCTRELMGASPEQAKAFAAIVAESGIDRHAPGLNARSWLAGPYLVGPHLSNRGRLQLDRISPASCDVDRDGDDIDAALCQVGGGFVEVTADAWRYFDAKGEEYKPAVYHTTGVCPLVPFVSFDAGDDWFAQAAHAGLVDATILCAYKQALGLYTRQVSGTPQMVIEGDVESTPPGQVLGHPVHPVVLPDGGKAYMLDRVVSAKDYLDEISAIITMAISGEGLPPGSITLQANNGDWGNLAISAEGPRLAVHRDKQVPHLRRSELELWPVVCDFLRGSTHRLARVLPSGDEVRDMLRVSFPDLSTPDEQLKRINVMVAGLPYGLSSPSDVRLAAQPELTRAEVEELRAKNLAEYLASVEEMTKRNTPADMPEAHGVQTLAQQQGRIGGQASGESRAAAGQEASP